MFRARPGDEQTRWNARDTRVITGEIAEMLSVLVIPALFLSGINLFLG